MDFKERKQILKLVDDNDNNKHKRKIQYADHLFKLKEKHQTVLHNQEMDRIILKKK